MQTSLYVTVSPLGKRDSRGSMQGAVRTIRAVGSALNLPRRIWPTLSRLVQSVLDNKAAERLGNRAPITVFVSFLAQETLRLIKTIASDAVSIVNAAGVPNRQCA